MLPQLLFQSKCKKVAPSHNQLLKLDQMGLVHHGSYVNYFEEARISWISNLGLSYSEMEKSGIILPVSKLNVQYLKPAYFDDELDVSVELDKIPTSRLIFNYIIKRENDIVVKGSTVLAFLNKKTKRPVRCPDYMLEKVTPLFK